MNEPLNYFIIPGLRETLDDIPSRDKILRIIAKEKNVNLELILTKSRDRDLVESRFIYIKALKTIYEMNLVSIGKELGKDHTTIIHALKQYENRYKYEEHFKKIANKIFVRLGVKVNQ